MKLSWRLMLLTSIIKTHEPAILFCQSRSSSVRSYTVSRKSSYLLALDRPCTRILCRAPPRTRNSSHPNVKRPLSSRQLSLSAQSKTLVDSQLPNHDVLKVKDPNSDPPKARHCGVLRPPKRQRSAPGTRQHEMMWLR